VLACKYLLFRQEVRVSSKNSNYDEGSRVSITLDNDSDLVPFAAPVRPDSSGGNMRFSGDDNSDLRAFDSPRSSYPPNVRNVATRNPVATSIAALGLGFLLGRLLR
jgi:hypothetical protein